MMRRPATTVALMVMACVVVASAVAGCSNDDTAEPIPRPDIAESQAAAEHTKRVVEAAIDLYETQGLDAAADQYNNPDNIDGQWYVFIVDDGGEVLVHYDYTRRGHDLNAWIGTDANGYQFGPEMLGATEDGKWVSYVYRNPATAAIDSEYFGDSQIKNVWVRRHDDLLFASGWYVDVETFMQSLAGEIMDAFDSASGSLDSMQNLLGAETPSSGLDSTLEYYNNTEGRGQSLAFVATDDGEIISTLGDAELSGRNIAEVLGPAALDKAAGGVWITEADNEPGAGPPLMRVWIVEADGHLFGVGWYDDTPG